MTKNIKSYKMSDILEKMYNQNPWWESDDLISKDFHIEEIQKAKYVFLNQDFLQHKFQDGVYIVTGPRQIGKTTHLKLFIKNSINQKNKENFFYFNCDLLDKKQDVVDLIEIYFKNFKKPGRKFILLDEITSITDSILAIKYLIDAGQRKGITYIITGSSTVNIKKTGEFLPGRRGKGKDFIFLPVNFFQFLDTQYPKLNFKYSFKEPLGKFYSRLKQKVFLAKELDNYLICGGIPRLINDYLYDEKIEHDNFTLYRDGLISEIAKNNKREALIKIILQRIISSLTSDISYNAFAVDTGIGSHNTVYEYLNFLEETFTIKQIYQYDFHQKKVSFRKNKKVYLNDCFLFWLFEWWLNGDFRAYKRIRKNPVLKSQLIENLIFLHLKYLFKEIYFYKNKQEIDFVHKDLAWESKYQGRVCLSDFKEMFKFPGKRFIVTKDTFKINEQYQLLPVDLFLLLDKEYYGFV